MRIYMAGKQMTSIWARRQIPNCKLSWWVANSIKYLHVRPHCLNISHRRVMFNELGQARKFIARWTIIAKAPPSRCSCKFFIFFIHLPQITVLLHFQNCTWLPNADASTVLFTSTFFVMILLPIAAVSFPEISGNACTGQLNFSPKSVYILAVVESGTSFAFSNQRRSWEPIIIEN